MRIPAHLVWLLALAALLAPGHSGAICDVIPGTTNQFRGALGATDRPFAMPGDFVELTVRPEVCDRRSARVADHDGNASITPADVLVTVLFEPPGAGAENAIVLATDCAAIASKLASCDEQLSGTAQCMTASGSDLQVSTSALDDRIRFRFPDTDALMGTASDDLTLSGPATIAVTPVHLPLPCGALATGRCVASGGLVACVDELYELDGTCGKQASQVEPTFPAFTALPVPNVYRQLCNTAAPGTPCNPIATELRLTVDAAGNALVPIDWYGIYLELGGIHTPRLVRGNVEIEAFAGGALDLLRVPSELLASYSPRGRRVAPIFNALSDSSSPNGATVFGSVDAEFGVVRVARKGSATLTCSGGANQGGACTSDVQCPGAECALFELGDRLFAGTGPIVVSSADFAFEAENPVPIEGLLETPSLISEVRSEALDNADLNADNDQTDYAMTLRDKATGTRVPIGRTTGEGRAATRVRQHPFRFPVVAAADDLVAFLEPEPLECDESLANAFTVCDRNDDGDVFDTLLRAYRLTGTSKTDLTLGSEIPADADPVIDGRSLAFSGGKLWFRSSEAALGTRGYALISSRDATTIAGEAASGSPSISADGRLVAFTSNARDMVGPQVPGSVAHVYVHDRDMDSDGTLDEPTSIQTTRASVDGSGTAGSEDSGPSAIAAELGDVAFYTASDLGTGAPGYLADASPQHFLYVRKRTPQQTVLLVGWRKVAGCDPASDDGIGLDLSANGRFAAFEVCSLRIDGDTNLSSDVYVYDRDLDGDGIFDEVGGDPASRLHRISVPSSSGNANDSVLREPPAISDDGRFVAFSSDASNLVSGDTNGGSDVFVRDRDSDGDGLFDEPGGTATIRVSVDRIGAQLSGNSRSVSMSADGRYVSFRSTARRSFGVNDGLLIHDRDADGDGVFDEQEPGARVTRQVYTRSDGGSPTLPMPAGPTALGAEGRMVGFESQLDLAPTPLSEGTDVALQDQLTGLTGYMGRSTAGAGPWQPMHGGVAAHPRLSRTGMHVAFSSNALLTGSDTNDTNDVFTNSPSGADLSADGDFSDTLLRFVDTNSSSIVTLCPASAVSVANGNAAFLRPEASGNASGCPVGVGLTLNGDGDALDEVVHYSPAGGAVQNEGLAATQVALSDTWLAALISEKAQGNLDRNDDGDKNDQVLAVRSISPPGAWLNLGQAARSIQIAGSRVAFLQAEADQNSNGNGDADLNDTVIRLYDAATASYATIGQAVDDFVLGDDVLAFRVREAAQGNQDLNQDGDTQDAVLQVCDFATSAVESSYQAATPCTLEACDPRIPYRVSGRTVTFLTLEAEQGNLDLDADGLYGGLVLQVFNAAAPLPTPPPGPVVPSLVLAGTKRGVCNTTGLACSKDGDCAGGLCFVPPGACIRDFGTSCLPEAVTTGCSAGQYCVPATGNPLIGTCHEDQGPCNRNADCTGPATCQDTEQQIQAVLPAFQRLAGGDQSFAAAGVCIEATAIACTNSDQCDEGLFCDGGFCKRSHDTCVTSADCAAGTCVQALTTATAADSDADDLADPIDNCPTTPNSDQADADSDGLGDACDAYECGDSVREGTPGEAGIEECDDGNQTPGDGCNATCQLEAPDCTDGFDNDGDGKVDYGLGATNDSGCVDASTAARENPQCSNGVDDDFDGQIDYPTDTKCKSVKDNDELRNPSTGCGLGGELLLALAALGAAARRRPRRQLAVAAR